MSTTEIQQGGTQSFDEHRSRELVLHFEQDDLARLCTDRDLSTTERHPSNDFYGQASVLKRYAGLSNSYSLKAIVEHAPVVEDTMWEPDRTARIGVNFSCTAARAAAMKKHSGRRSIPIGFGYLYADRLIEQMYGPPALTEQRCGTIVFPFKSTHHFRTEFDNAKYAEILAALPEEMQPMTICMFWKDYLNGSHIPYQQAGHRVVSAGHMFDPDFMLRIADLCQQHRFCVSNEFGTYVFQSLISGCCFSYVRSGPIRRHIPEELRKSYVRDMPCFSRVRDRSWELFEGLHFSMSPEQREFADVAMGARHFKTPGALKRLILLAEFYDKCMPLYRFDEDRIVRSSPEGLRRMWQSLASWSNQKWRVVRRWPDRALKKVLTSTGLKPNR